MQKIVPNLWFDKEAVEATKWYASIFPDSKVNNVTTLHDTPSGDTDLVSFTLSGQEFMAMSAGPLFKFNPSTSFMVNYDPATDPDARKHLDEAWAQLTDGGEILMPLQEYPFSQHYGWVQDKYGLSWQLILTDPSGEKRPFIIPSLLFVNEVVGKAEEAMKFYLSVFPDSQTGAISKYGEGHEPDKPGTVMFADFRLFNMWFAVMDSAHEHKFAFNEAISFMVHCEDQAEIDAYWEKLSAVPESEQCGWLKDKYGVSWQIVPTAMEEMMSKGTPEQMARVTQAFLQMKKYDLNKLQEAYEGK
jgi:predicted 3-demethylubiquinone-9 3-methyltransferase (glyoxalase superfamily)